MIRLSKKRLSCFVLAIVAGLFAAAYYFYPFPFSLKSPYIVSREYYAKDFPHDFKCDKPSGAVIDLTFSGYYEEGDQTHSHIDPAAFALQKQQRAPLRFFENKIVSMANMYEARAPQSPEIAACTLYWLDQWAKGKALQGGMSATGRHVRKWFLGIVAASYLQVRDDTALSISEKADVQAWIKTLALLVIADYTKGDDLPSRKNNHMNWAAYNVALAGVALNDYTFYNWGLTRFKEALDAIEQDGVLPLEMKRGSRALQYHVFALAPLVMMADLAFKNGNDLFGENNFSLRRAVKRVLAGLDDPSFYTGRAGAAQNIDILYNPSMLAWLEIYNHYYPDDGAEKWLRKFRPMAQTRLGGNVTMLYGVKGSGKGT